MPNVAAVESDELWTGIVAGLNRQRGHADRKPGASSRAARKDAAPRRAPTGRDAVEHSQARLCEVLKIAQGSSVDAMWADIVAKLNREYGVA